VDARAVTDPSVAGASGVDHAQALLAFADAVVGDDDEALAAARRTLLGEMGAAALVDAAAVASNFQRMVRIADGTGIPLDAPLDLLSQDLRAELRLQRFGSAANTPVSGPVRRALGGVLRPVARRAVRLMAALRRR
jgi:hypothetical protein